MPPLRCLWLASGWRKTIQHKEYDKITCSQCGQNLNLCTGEANTHGSLECTLVSAVSLKYSKWNLRDHPVIFNGKSTVEARLLIPAIPKKAGSLSWFAYYFSSLWPWGPVGLCKVKSPAEERPQQVREYLWLLGKVTLKMYSKPDVLRKHFPPSCFCNSSWQNFSIQRLIVNTFRLCPAYILRGTYTAEHFIRAQQQATHKPARGISV